MKNCSKVIISRKLVLNDYANAVEFCTDDAITPNKKRFAICILNDGLDCFRLLGKEKGISSFYNQVLTPVAELGRFTQCL